MAKMDAKVMQELDERIEALGRGIETAGQDGRNRLKGINVDGVRQGLPRKDRKLEESAWNALPESRQQELHQQFVQILDSLHKVAAPDGPGDPRHIMHDDYATNTMIILWAIMGLLLTGFLLTTIASRWNRATGTDFTPAIQTASAALAEFKAARDNTEKAKAAAFPAQQTPAATQKASMEDQKAAARHQEAVSKLADTEKEAEKRANNAAVEAIQTIQKTGVTEGAVLTMVILLGMLGGSLHLLSSLGKFVGNRRLKRSWLLFYLIMPWTGAGLAPIVYMLIRVGIVSPSGAAAGGTGPANLNLIAIYAFAALTGLCSKTAMEKLAEVFGALFHTRETPSKDALVPGRPPGDS
jgi:hypothetical protein